MPRPDAILVVSAHWEAAPLTIGSTTTETPLTYDFWGFPEHYYDVTYDAPGAPGLAARVQAVLPDGEPVSQDPSRRLDHGAYVPLTVMYPDADVPVLQISMPTLDPQRLLALGARLRPLRDEGVLVIGSGFTTHGCRSGRPSPGATPPGWSVEFDAWASERMASATSTRSGFRAQGPGCPIAHPPSSTSPRCSSRSARPIRPGAAAGHRRLLDGSGGTVDPAGLELGYGVFVVDTQFVRDGGGRRRLPQLIGDRFFVTDGGIETDLIFHGGIDMPHFAAFPLLENADPGAAAPVLRRCI